jgi:hypothetical protein
MTVSLLNENVSVYAKHPIPQTSLKTLHLGFSVNEGKLFCACKFAKQKKVIKAISKK